MKKAKFIILILLFAVLSFGCQSSDASVEAAVPTTETVHQTEVPSIPEEEETKSGIDHEEAYQWMINLQAEDVAFVEFLNLSDAQFPYRRYEGEEIQVVIDLFQAKQCPEYEPILEYMPILQWPGYYSKEFHVVMQDGTAHTVCSVYSTATVIDGTAYHTISAWLNNHWPETGNAPLPEGWAQEAAARNYHISEDSASTHSTQSHENDRFHLDQSYNTDVAFGSRSRHYPIGRGGIELSASEGSATGVSLTAYWTGTGIITQLRIQPQYWLEKWQEDTGSYIPFNGGEFLAEAPQSFLPDASRSWYVSWKDSLEPGHYRLGMTFYEEYNGGIQNETICYAKFSITEAN